MAKNVVGIVIYNLNGKTIDTLIEYTRKAIILQEVSGLIGRKVKI